MVVEVAMAIVAGFTVMPRACCFLVFAEPPWRLPTLQVIRFEPTITERLPIVFVVMRMARGFGPLMTAWQAAAYGEVDRNRIHLTASCDAGGGT